MGYEFELKFRTDESVLDALLHDIAGEEQTFLMHTTYYDTPDGHLSARHYTLRRRMENDRSVCTLKIPAEGLGRGEFELECDSMEEALPMLCKLSGVEDLMSLTANGLEEVCGAKFTRIAKTINWNGTTLEVALDSGALYGGMRVMPICEVEVELKDGQKEDAISYGSFLAAAYGLEPETASKFRRGLALYRGE